MGSRRDALRERAASVDPLQWVGLGLAGGYAGLVTLFVAGDAVTDPGGWVGIGGSVAWVACLAGLGLLGWCRPRAALVTLGVLVAAPLAFGVWSLLDHGAAQAWEDSRGPVSLVLVVLVVAPATVAGLSRPRAAGWLVLVACLAPVLLEAAGAGARFYEPLSVGLVLLPFVASGVLLVLAARQPDRSPAPPG